MNQDSSTGPAYAPFGETARGRAAGGADPRQISEFLALLNQEGITANEDCDFEQIVRSRSGPYAALMRHVARIDYEEGEAKKHWQAIRRHRQELSDRIGRDPGVSVTVLDYFHNICRKLAVPAIVERKALEATERRSMTDPLTGLFNRRFFELSLEREVTRVHRYGDGFSLALLDLDDFSRIRDEYAPSIGDDALVHASSIVRQNLRITDLPCHHGGGAFAVLLPRTGRIGAYVLADRIRAEMQRRFEERLFGERVLALTVSGGVAAFPDDANSAEELVMRADRALYYSKRQGKNRVLVHSGDRKSPRSSPRSRWSDAKRHARRQRRPLPKF